MKIEPPQVVIFTSITDGYDTLKTQAPQIGIGTKWIAVTDGTEKAEPGHGWEIMNFSEIDRLITPADRTHPNRLAKIAKCTPWQIFSCLNSIWIDASYRVTSPLFAFEATKCAHPIAQFVHPWRDCIYDEADASRKLERYHDQGSTINSQVREYDSIGHPRNWGLWATGVIARRHTDDVKTMSTQWLAEIRRHSYQDQISEAVSLRFCDLRPTPLPGNHLQNPWLTYEGSARHA